MCRHVQHCECEADVAVHAHGMGQEQVLHDLVNFAEWRLAGAELDPSCLDGAEILGLLRSGKWLDEVYAEAEEGTPAEKRLEASRAALREFAAKYLEEGGQTYERSAVADDKGPR